MSLWVEYSKEFLENAAAQLPACVHCGGKPTIDDDGTYITVGCDCEPTAFEGFVLSVPTSRWIDYHSGQSFLTQTGSV